MQLSALLLTACLASVSCGWAATTDTTNRSSNDQEIQPFSSLRWDDGLVDVVTKLNKFSGLKTLEWFGDAGETKSVLNVIDVEELSVLASALYHRPNEEFKDHDGKTVLSPVSKWDATFIEAAEISIAGIPFSLKAALELEPGFAIAYTNKVISFKTNQGVAKLPAVLTSVELSSKSPVIPEKLNDLVDTAKTKYPKGEMTERTRAGLRTGAFKAADKIGHTFKLTWMAGAGAAEAKISYEYPGASIEWAELYRKHLAALEENGNKGKKDSKSEL